MNLVNQLRDSDRANDLGGAPRVGIRRSVIGAAPVEEILRMIAELRPKPLPVSMSLRPVCKINRHEECVLAQLAERTHTITPAQEPSGVPV